MIEPYVSVLYVSKSFIVISLDVFPNSIELGEVNPCSNIVTFAPLLFGTDFPPEFSIVYEALNICSWSILC